jgi:hypothetical protein
MCGFRQWSGASVRTDRLGCLFIGSLLGLMACSSEPVGSMPGPLFGLSQATIGFYAAPGGANPSAQVDSIHNGGVGTLSGLAVGGITYGASQPTGWLSATLSATTAPAALTLTVATGSLVAGTYTAMVWVTASGVANSPQAVGVTFTVTATPPFITLSQATASFSAAPGGGNPGAQVDSIHNGGGGTLTGLAVGGITYGTSQPTGWLSATLSAATAPAELTLTAATGSLVAGTYTATVSVTASGVANNPQAVGVTFTVTTTPLISMSHAAVGFVASPGGADPSAQVDSVHNGGVGTLSGLAVALIGYGTGQPTGWLNASLNATTAPVALTLAVMTAGLAAGTYTAVVYITASGAPNSPQTVAVTFTVEPPLIRLARSDSIGIYAALGGANSTVTDSIYDGGGGTLSGLAVASITYGASQPTGWLNATLSATTAPAALTLTGKPGTLAAGIYTATLTVTASGAANSPQTVSNLMFTVSPSVFDSVTASGFEGFNWACALTPAGGAYCWGDYGGPAPVGVSGGLTFAQVSAGDRFTCGITIAGAGYCWGQNDAGQLGDGGRTSTGAPQAVLGSLTFAEITAGTGHACGLTAAGLAYCWGDNDYGNVGDGTTMVRLSPVPVAGGLTFATIKAGFYDTCGITTGGAAYCWGLNSAGELGNDTVGGEDSTPTPVQGGVSFAAISPGLSHTCGLTAAGVAYCWGGGSGVGGGTSGPGPLVAVSGGLTFTVISAGNQYTCAVTTASAAYCWGDNTYGTLGDGTVTTSLTPVPVAGGLTFVTVSSGAEEACGVTTTEAVYCWGTGALGDGVTRFSTTPARVE